ncbi:hypothetical protein [Oryzicola mucosus]|uniref:DUF1127 domain-containing protein n=1 Tax=Oryzicola mucosus TaxID=2767425 RepID=A0A8J6Q0Z5_9HYPH|nr:hypothetical protein [Oryzicola mucosus]MBD0414275.1 hypothetical protein [Oryzicola mucosus]
MTVSVFEAAFFTSLRQYAGKVSTLRNEIRTERFLSSLPVDLRKDIGWPDIHAARRARRFGDR